MGKVKPPSRADLPVLRELARWPKGSGAICQVMPAMHLRALERKGLVELCGLDRLGERWRLSAAGREWTGS